MILLSSDYDGTYDIGDTSVYNITLNKAHVDSFIKKGNIFMINTGRCPVRAQEAIDYGNIPYNYLATGDGTALFDKTGNLLYFKELDEKIIEEFLRFAILNKIDHVEYLDSIKYSMERRKSSKLGCVSLGVEEKDYSKELEIKYKEFASRYPDYEFTIYPAKGIKFFCLKPKGVNKSLPIRYLMNKYGILLEDVYTIGDEANDYDMIKDFNGFHIVNPMIKNNPLEEISLGGYDAVHKLVKAIERGTAKKRKR